jgi:putative transposase
MIAMRVTAKQLAGALDCTRRTIQRRAVSQNWPYILATGLGGERRLYDFDGLSPLVKKRFIKRLANTLDFSVKDGTTSTDDICVIQDNPPKPANNGLAEHLFGVDALPLTADFINDENVMKAGVLSLALLYAEQAGLSKIKGLDSFADKYKAEQLPVQQCVYDRIKCVSRVTLLRWEKSLPEKIKAKFVNLLDECEEGSFQVMLMAALAKLKITLSLDEQTRLMELLAHSNVVSSI